MSAAPARSAADDAFDLLLPPDIPARAPVPKSAQTFSLSGRTMGTGWSLEAVASRSVSSEQIETILARCFSCVIDQMSQWESDSQISRYNSGAADSRHSIGPQFRQVLECALAIQKASNGAFDPLLGQTSSAWGFGATTVDDPSEARASLSRYDQTSILTDDPAILLQPGNAALDLSGIAKGFAVDLALTSLEQLGIAHALLDIGGELKAIGFSGNRLPWWVDLAQPPRSATPATRIGLSGWAVATSGHWERRRHAHGRSWSHTFDPVTNMPVNDTLSATVLHPGCMQADALATALIVMGMEEGIRFADRHKLPARIVGTDQVGESAAWRVWKA